MAGEQRTGLTVRCVESLDHAIEPAIAFLQRGVADRDLLDIDHVIVPNAGVRAWFLHVLSTRLGVARGGDGIAAGVSVRYIGELDRLIGKSATDADPWAVGPLAVSLLSIIDAPGTSWAAHAARMGGGLRAARLMADRFDRYHARRPSMILEWEDGRAVLARELGDEAGDDGRYLNARPLAPHDTWQFDLWREARRIVGTAPWPVVVRDLTADPSSLSNLDLPPRLLLLGHQSLSVRHLEVLSLLADHLEIEALLHHPSPVLARRWATEGAITLSPGVAPTLERVVVDPDIDELVGMWLRGSRETQVLMRSQGVAVELPDMVTPTVPSTLLDAVKESIRTGRTTRVAYDRNDSSLRIHRAHNLSRQVEVLHDALLHAFAEDSSLAPHDVAILCADIAKAAPLLTATFGRAIETSHGPVRIPLVVADRGLREVDDGARLLSDLVRAVSGRFSVADVLAVATNSLVRERFEVSDSDIAAWSRVIDRGRVRWGLSAAQRNDSDPDLDLRLEAHTWAGAFSQALVGAMLPPSVARVDFGGVVPMPDLEPADINPVSTLLAVIGVLADLHDAIHGEMHYSIVEWADILDTALIALAGDETDGIDDARAALNTLRSHVVAARGDAVGSHAVVFTHFAEQLDEQITSNPGRQSVRTGAVVATSMVPLRAVPYKVVCLVGFDESVLAAGDPEGDDLLSRQQFVGDPDARLEERRAILDALCAASSRVIITCNGRSIKNNEKLPLITPLAELTDLCERCGATPIHGRSVIEHMHPRHFSARRNFESGGVVLGMVWSHDRAALRAVDGDVDAKSEAARLAATAERRIAREKKPEDAGQFDIDIDRLRWCVRDPLSAFVRDSLDIWIRRSEATDVPAVIPFDTSDADFRVLAREWASARADNMEFPDWCNAQIASGRVPPGLYGKDVTSRVRHRVDEFHDLAVAWGFDPVQREHIRVHLPFPEGTIVGNLWVNRTDEGRLVVHPFADTSTGFENQESTALTLLAARAMGVAPADALVCVIGEELGAEKTVAYPVLLDPSITTEVAAARLRAMASLMVRARAHPYPRFGKTVERLLEVSPKKGTPKENARKEFTSFVAASGGTFGPAYARTHESLVFGPSPEFDEIFNDQGPVRKFFVDFESVLLRQRDDKVKELGLSMNEAPPYPAPANKAIKGRKRYLYS